MSHSPTDSEVVTFSNASSPTHGRSLALWCSALILGGSESAITYDAMVGLNWALLALAATVAIFVCSWRTNERTTGQRLGLVALILTLAATLTVTADRFWQFLIAVALIATLSVQVLGLLGHRGDYFGPLRLAFGPFASILAAFQESARRTRELLEQLQADASLPVIRAVSLSLPVVLVLTLLLSGADPTIATLRDAIVKALSQISIIPRFFWFALLSAQTLGGLGLALQPRPPISESTRLDPQSLRFSQTDQLAVLGSAAAVFAAYLALQISYLFGNSGALLGSHVTYAESVHRGFTELNAAVTLSALITCTLSSRSAAKPMSRLSKAAAIALIVESQILAISALHRVRLYEEAYGYTEQRLLVQVYSIAAIAVLAMLGWEIIRGLEFRRLARQVSVLGVLILSGLVFWNHEAWIVRANLARYRRTGQLDAAYLIYGLGPDGLPELAHRLASLDPLRREELENCIRTAAGRFGLTDGYRWFEWTARREALRQVLEQYHYPTRANEQPPKPCRT